MDDGGRGDSQVTKHKVPAVAGGTTLKCERTCVKDMAATLLTVMLMIPYICEGGEIFLWHRMTIYINIHLSSRIWDINALPVYVTALLRKSTATDFLQKVREKRSSECFPGGCSTEDNETGELMEVDVSYVSSPSTVFSFAFDADRGFPTANMNPVHLLKFSFGVLEYFHFVLFYIFYFLLSISTFLSTTLF